MQILVLCSLLLVRGPRGRARRDAVVGQPTAAPSSGMVNGTRPESGAARASVSSGRRAGAGCRGHSGCSTGGWPGRTEQRVEK